jgi:hypothetical protein
MKRYKYLKEFTFGSCIVRTRAILGFTAQKWLDDDPLEQRETAVFFYYPEKPDESKWAVSGLGQATGVHGCAAFVPEERWVFVLDDGEVYVVGKGDDDYEKPISAKPNLYFSNARAVRRGRAVAVGSRRKVFIREAKDRWTQLSNGLFPQGDKTDLEHAGFNDIDGFSEKDMYACGGRGDLWHYDGNRWRQVDVPTDAVLQNICCGEDGLVYITTNRRHVLIGRQTSWEVLEQEETEELLESIIWYGDTAIVSTLSSLYAVSRTSFGVPDIGAPPLKTTPLIGAGDGVLLVAGSDEAAMYVDKKWTVILEPERR